MVLKKRSVLVILVYIGVVSSVARTVQGADQKLMTTVATLPELSRELINVTPLNTTSTVAAVAQGQDMGQLISAFPDALISKNIVPSALSALATNMKNPYLLLAVGEGIAITYFLLGQQMIPSQAAQAYFDSLNKNLIVSAIKGSVVVSAKTASAGMITSSGVPYIKPLLIGGALAGFATAYFSPTLSDDQKVVAYAGLVAACSPIVDDMYALFLGKNSTGQQTIAQKVGKTKKNKQRIHAAVQKTERSTNIAIALLALGGVVTTVQAYQEGTLSADMHLLAGITLSSAVALARETVLYEYGYRATQKSIAVGSQIVTHVIAEPIKQYGQWLVDGVFNAFGWGQ